MEGSLAEEEIEKPEGKDHVGQCSGKPNPGDPNHNRLAN